MSLESCRIVLIETHSPGNLGAVARVMRNFGFGDLVLVAPIADRKDQNARQMATHGDAILENARVVANLNEAIGDCALVVGTSAKCGGLYRVQNVGTPRALFPRVVDVLHEGSRVALVFGPEPTGLSNDVITRCHHLIQIPTGDEYPALNLAQAVAICLYELYTHWQETPRREPGDDALAPFATQELMFSQLQEALEEIHFLYGDKAGPLMHAVRHLLGRANLTEMEVKLLLGMARQIRWHVANHPGRIV